MGWNEKAVEPSDNSGSQPGSCFRPRGASRAWGSGWHFRVKSGPHPYLPASLSHLPPFLVPRNAVSNTALRGHRDGLGGGAALDGEVGKR